MNIRLRIAIFLTMGVVATGATAAEVTSVADGTYTSTNTWSDGLAPAVGNDYVIIHEVFMRNIANTTLAGDSVRIDSGGYFRKEQTGTAEKKLITDDLQLNGGSLQFTSDNKWSRKFLVVSNITVISSSEIQLGRGASGNKTVKLAGGLSGSGNLAFIGNAGNSADDYQYLYLQEANSTYTGNWTVDRIDSGSAYLRADAANALGSGSVTLGTNSVLVVDAANGINSISGVTLSEATSLLSLDNAWSNDTAVLTMTDGTLNLSNTVSTILDMTIGGYGVNVGTHTAASLAALGLGGTFEGTGTLTILQKTGPNPPSPPPTISSFTATPSSVNPGEQVTLAWTTLNATGLSIDQGIGDVTGLTSTNIAVFVETTFSLIATNPDGSATSSVPVSVIFGQPNTAFSAAIDNDWNTDGNWTNDVPGPDSDTTVNGNLTADLGAGSGSVKNLEVGGITGESGTVVNGTLVIVEALNVATATNSVGVVDLGSGSLTLASDSRIGSGVASSGTVDVATLDMNLAALTIGLGRDSYGRATIDSGDNLGKLSIGSGSNSVAHFEVLSGNTTFGHNIYAASGRDSEITMTFPSALTVTNGGNFNIAEGDDSAGTFEAYSLTLADAGSDFFLGRGDNSTATFNLSGGNLTFDARGSQFILGRGDNSTSTLNLGGGKIVMNNSTNDFEVGLGVGSSHNLTASDFNITGPIGNFVVDDGTGALTNLFNAHDSVGELDINVPFEITAQTHELTKLNIGADLILSGGTTTLRQGAALNVADVDHSTVTVDLANWIANPSTNGFISVGRANEATGTLIAADLVLDADMNVGGGGTNSSGTVTLDSLKNHGNNRDLRIADDSTAAYGKVTVAGDMALDDVFMGAGTSSYAELSVGGNMAVDVATVGGSASSGSNSLSIVTVDTDLTLNKLNMSLGSNSTATVTVDGIATIKNNGSTSKWAGGVDSTATLNFNGASNSTKKVTMANGAGSQATVAFNGSGDTTMNVVSMAGGSNSTATLDFNVASAVTIDGVTVASGEGATGTLTAGNLTMTASLNVGTGSTGGGDATVILGSLSGDKILTIVHVGTTSSTGTVEIAGDASVSDLKVGQGVDSLAILSVGGTLDISRYFNVDLNGAGSTSIVTADTIYTTNQYNNIDVAGDDDTDSRVTANSGDLKISKLKVATSNGSKGVFEITNGVATLGDTLEIGTADSSDGTVLLAFTSIATNTIDIGTSSNAVGRLTQTGGTLIASELTLGSENAGVNGVGIINLAGGNLVVADAVDAAAGSYIDVTSDASTLQLVGAAQSVFEALWATGALRSNGESGLTGKLFLEYFYLTGDTIAETPIGFISIANAVGGVDLSWNSTLSQSYNVQTNLNLVFPAWGVYTNVTGDGGIMTVTVPASAGAVYYQVTAPIAE